MEVNLKMGVFYDMFLKCLHMFSVTINTFLKFPTVIK